MKYKIFVDGQEGTTGLKIYDRLSIRNDLEIMMIDAEKRKDIAERRKFINEADVVFLCLPETAAREAVSLVENEKTRVIDASVAFRTNAEWTYGMPELNKNQREKIKNAKKVSVPGCHASGFVLALNPLVQEGIVPDDYPISSYSITGYSGGGKKLIEKYENKGFVGDTEKYPKHYALNLNHKHVPEMQKFTGLKHVPIFNPIVCDYFKGMGVSIPLFSRCFKKKMSASDVREFLASYYEGEKFVSVMPYGQDDLLEGGFFNLEKCNDTNKMEIFVFGNDDQVMLLSRFDNLGKGASGAAVQNMNILLGIDEGTGL